MTGLRPPTQTDGDGDPPPPSGRGWRSRAHAVTAAAFVWTASTGDLGAQTSPDNGGNLQAYIADVQRLNAGGRGYRIEGRCASACTVYLGVRRVCVATTAELWFHAAFLPGGDRPDRTGSLLMLAMYPAAVRRWAIATGALEQIAWSPQHRLSGEQLIHMGLARCTAHG